MALGGKALHSFSGGTRRHNGKHTVSHGSRDFERECRTTPRKAAHKPSLTRFVALLLIGLLLGACSLENADLDSSTPAIISFEVSPLGVTAGQQTTFIWEVRGAARATCTLDVDGDGAPDYAPDCDGGSQRHTYPSSGIFDAILTVETAQKRIQEQITTQVQAANETEADFSVLTWRPSTPQPHGVAEAQGLALNGKLYSFGGFDSTKGCCTPTDRAYVFDPKAEKWTLLAPMPAMNGTKYGGMTHAGIATDGESIYFAGGYTASTSGRAQIFGTREVLRYDPTSDTYARLPDLPVERAAGQLEYFGGKLYYFGGTNQARTEDTGSLYILDLKQGAESWREGTPLPNPRNHLGGVVLGGKIFAIAGQHAHDGRLTTQPDVHAYDPKLDSWQRVASLPLPLSHIADSSFALGGRIIVVGGEIDHLKPVANIFAYEPQTDTWSELSSLPIARMSTVADVVNGTIITAGGAGGKRGADTFVATLTD